MFPTFTKQISLFSNLYFQSFPKDLITENSLDFVRTYFGPFVEKLKINMVTLHEFDYFKFFQGFQALTYADIGDLSPSYQSQFCQAQKDNLNLKKLAVEEHFSTSVIEELQQIEILICGLDFILEINKLKDMKPYFMLKSIRLSTLKPDSWQKQIDIELNTFLQNVQRKFPNLKTVFLEKFWLSQVHIIPMQTQHLIYSISIDNKFNVIAENLRTVANSMVNCQSIFVRTKDKSVDLAKIAKLDNVSTFHLTALKCKLKLEDIFHILIQMPMLRNMNIRTYLLRSDLSHDELLNLFGNRFNNFAKVKLSYYKLENIEWKTIRMLEIIV